MVWFGFSIGCVFMVELKLASIYSSSCFFFFFTFYVTNFLLYTKIPKAQTEEEKLKHN